ncbi:hypothetical protein C5E07_11470 [Pseudoclavibacter sp. RFBJ3]|uniref:hypothetical protein n=1 Tax=unclassified Pseudoclavibacter TaxID=2615177 RepID=UPI000CE8F76F|nr:MULTISPECIES: hypothetical protein [unclassified Pseudoclavibacter]PPF83304.1 hypothetical protein C5C12_10545 [Pseudoclavibacter sp. RFBJ5]PPF91846.1 hypothetical protein C5E07_11470 [Pseudoclavibacter sp. RFBJ3]PPG01106.1 hypothetical protein C5C19_00485 [Pseudoclavibacter sp. RFBH5]PPG26209.1 hypothetical protein C5E13_00440 [Pseudoclavibacter sp. RFBI4]
MARELSVEEAVQRAQQLQEDRIGAIRGLAEARQNLADTRDDAARRLAEVQRETAELIAAAEREDVKRYAAAQSAGWSADELRKVGYPEPEKKTRVRKRQARKSPAQSTPDNGTSDASGVADENPAE